MTLNLDNLTGREIKQLIRRGILDIMQNQSLPQTIEDTPEWQKHKHLKGQEISIREASRKYEIPPKTISRWAKRKIIRILRDDGYRKYLDESCVAYCAEVRSARGGSGKWLFDDNGLPYTPTTRPA